MLMTTAKLANHPCMSATQNAQTVPALPTKERGTWYPAALIFRVFRGQNASSPLSRAKRTGHNAAWPFMPMWTCASLDLGSLFSCRLRPAPAAAASRCQRSGRPALPSRWRLPSLPSARRQASHQNGRVCISYGWQTQPQAHASALQICQHSSPWQGSITC
jgi:hypothetical protein